MSQPSGYYHTRFNGFDFYYRESDGKRGITSISEQQSITYKDTEQMPETGVIEQMQKNQLNIVWYEVNPEIDDKTNLIMTFKETPLFASGISDVEIKALIDFLTQAPTREQSRKLLYAVLLVARDISWAGIMLGEQEQRQWISLLKQIKGHPNALSILTSAGQVISPLKQQSGLSERSIRRLIKLGVTQGRSRGSDLPRFLIEIKDVMRVYTQEIGLSEKKVMPFFKTLLDYDYLREDEVIKLLWESISMIAQTREVKTYDRILDDLVYIADKTESQGGSGASAIRLYSKTYGKLVFAGMIPEESLKLLRNIINDKERAEDALRILQQIADYGVLEFGWKIQPFIKKYLRK